MPTLPTISVNSRKYDGQVRRTWQAGLIRQHSPAIVLVGRFMEDVHHPDLGHIAKDTASFEYFWTDRWYNVFAMYEPDSTLRNWYCNIAMPATFDGSTLDFIDLDIDVVIWPDGSRAVLDMDDFQENQITFAYPATVTESALQSLDDLMGVIDRREFPFNQNTK